MENKDVLGRYKQAQEYLKKAKETYQEITVSERYIVLAWRDAEYAPCPVATYHGPISSIIWSEVTAPLAYFYPMQGQQVRGGGYERGGMK